jgi:exosortase
VGTTINPAIPVSLDRERRARSSSTSDWLIALTLVLLWGYAVYRLGMLWYSNTDYTFGWFVPLLALALFWERYTWRPPRDVVHPADGTLLLLVACALCVSIGTLFLEVIPNWRFAGWIFVVPIVIVTITGCYFLGGRSWARHFAFPIVFFLVAVPWPTRFEQALVDTLSDFNASISVIASNLLGVVAMQHGRLIETGGGFVGVDDACSGIRSFQSSVMVALFLGELFRYSIARRLLLLFSAVAFAFACNVVRTTYLVCTCDLKGLEAVNLRHDEAGFTILGVTLAGLLVVTWLVRPRKRRQRRTTASSEKQVAPSQAERSPLEKDPQGRTATSARGPAWAWISLLALLLWLVVVETGIELWFRTGESQAANGMNWTLRLPVQNPDFTEVKISANVRTMLDYDEGKSAQWRDTSGHPWQMFYFRWLPAANRYRATEMAGEAYGHKPDVCLRNAGMILETNFGTRTIDMNHVRLQVYIEKFLDGGRCLYVATCNWEPVLWDKPEGQPSTGLALRQAVQAFRNRDRNWMEKRVLKMGVWDMDTDEDATAAIRNLLATAVTK